MAEDNVQHHDIEKERPQRRKLHLKPRDPEAAARIEAERLRESYQHGVFGDAKPREVVIADRVGKSEEDILKEEVQKEKLHVCVVVVRTTGSIEGSHLYIVGLQLRLTPAQHEEKKSHEAAVKEIEDQIEKESDEKKKDLLRVELRARVETLDVLMERFVAMTLENAKSGDVPRVSQLRKVQHEVHQHERGGPAGVVHQHRYKPTQQYTSRHPGQQYTGRGGGHPPRGGGGGRSGYVPTPVDGGRYGRGGVAEWAHPPYHQPGRGGGGGGGGGVDAGAVMYPEYSAHRGGRGGGRQQLPPRDVFYQGPFPGRGVGGEIEFDSFSDQDRY
ncbi:hypothetical protein PSENEW3_00001619 [Picochlorum sp. SENEW3]|nr:hypothetical protein PSENEW3_00001619 [Picochlorum sp. SENEW3]